MGTGLPVYKSLGTHTRTHTHIDNLLLAWEGCAPLKLSLGIEGLLCSFPTMQRGMQVPPPPPIQNSGSGVEQLIQILIRVGKKKKKKNPKVCPILSQASHSLGKRIHETGRNKDTSILSCIKCMYAISQLTNSSCLSSHNIMRYLQICPS